MKCVTKPFTVGTYLVSRNVINLTPPYQRESGIWSTAKKQLFIDSLINEFDVPKIYVHDVSDKSARYDYTVIDGKQRLSAIWEFLDDGFPLDTDTFKLTLKRPLKAPPTGGMRFSDFSTEWAELFKSRTIDTVLVQSASPDDIEELFSRLNNGEPLNAAEKRNALGGVVPELIRRLTQHDFFKRRVPFSNARYQHLEVAAKFLLIEETEKRGADFFCDLKKRHLDDFVKRNRTLDPSSLKSLETRVSKALAPLMSVFNDRDRLLGKQAYLPMYYLFMKVVMRDYAHRNLYTRIHDFLEWFHAERIANLAKPEDDRDPVLVEFGRLVQQGTNDRESLRTRVSILRRFFLQTHADLEFRDPRRAFSEEERFAIWILAKKKCQECGRDLPDLDDMDADHQLQWAFGGATSIENSRALCAPCNVKLASRVR